MSYDVVVRLDDQVLEKVTDVDFSDGKIRIDKGVTANQVRNAAGGDLLGTVRLTVVVRRHKDD